MSGKEQLFLILFLIPAGVFLTGAMGFVASKMILSTFGTCQDKYIETRGSWVVYDVCAISPRNCSYRKQGAYDNVWEQPYSCYIYEDCNSVSLPAHIVASVFVSILMAVGIGCFAVGVSTCISSLCQFPAAKKLKNN